MSLRSPLGKARGLGSAKEGVEHWWAQRVTAIAMVPLILWLVFSFVLLDARDHATVVAWLADPAIAIGSFLLVATLLYHSQLGLQVVIEDYVHGEGLKLVTLLLMKFAHIVIAAISLFALLKISQGAA